NAPVTSLPNDLKPVWKLSIGGGFSSPVIAGGKLVYLDENGAQEVAHLIDAKTGKEIWNVPVADRYEDEWGAGPRSTPFFDGDDEAAYSSPIIATLAGVKQVVYLSADSLAGYDPKNGKILWRVPLKTDAKRHACSPVIIGDTVTVNSHTFGTICFKIVMEGGRLKALEAWANKDLKTNLGTAVAVGDCLYNQGANRDYVCFDARTGQLKWSQPGFGQGRKDYSSTIVAGKNLLVLTEDGTLLLLAA